MENGTTYYTLEEIEKGFFCIIESVWEEGEGYKKPKEYFLTVEEVIYKIKSLDVAIEQVTLLI